jgi:hypothetical protein
MFDFDINDIEVGGFTPHTSIQKDKILESANNFERELPFDEFSIFISPLGVLKTANGKTAKIVFGMSNKDYHAEKDHVSSSKVKTVNVTEWHYVNYGKSKFSGSPSMELGTLIHDDIEARTNFGKWQDWSVGSFKTVTTIKDETKEVHLSRFNCIQNYRKFLERDPITAQLINFGIAEISFFVDASEFGIPLKIRCDNMVYEPATDTIHVFDWKSTREINKFQWQIKDLKYDLSAGMYSTVLERITGKKVLFHFVLIETGNALTGLTQIRPVSEKTLKTYKDLFLKTLEKIKGIDLENPNSYDMAIL